jgi:hypothetical protein
MANLLAAFGIHERDQPKNVNAMIARKNPWSLPGLTVLHHFGRLFAAAVTDLENPTAIIDKPYEHYMLFLAVMKEGVRADSVPTGTLPKPDQVVWTNVKPKGVLGNSDAKLIWPAMVVVRSDLYPKLMSKEEFESPDTSAARKLAGVTEPAKLNANATLAPLKFDPAKLSLELDDLAHGSTLLYNKFMELFAVSYNSGIAGMFFAVDEARAGTIPLTFPGFSSDKVAPLLTRILKMRYVEQRKWSGTADAGGFDDEEREAPGHAEEPTPHATHEAADATEEDTHDGEHSKGAAGGGKARRVDPESALPPKAFRYPFQGWLGVGISDATLERSQAFALEVEGPSGKSNKCRDFSKITTALVMNGASSLPENLAEIVPYLAALPPMSSITPEEVRSAVGALYVINSKGKCKDPAMKMKTNLSPLLSSSTEKRKEACEHLMKLHEQEAKSLEGYPEATRPRILEPSCPVVSVNASIVCNASKKKATKMHVNCEQEARKSYFNAPTLDAARQKIPTNVSRTGKLAGLNFRDAYFKAMVLPVVFSSMGTAKPKTAYGIRFVMKRSFSPHDLNTEDLTNYLAKLPIGTYAVIMSNLSPMKGPLFTGVVSHADNTITGLRMPSATFVNPLGRSSDKVSVSGIPEDLLGTTEEEEGLWGAQASWLDQAAEGKTGDKSEVPSDTFTPASYHIGGAGAGGGGVGAAAVTGAGFGTVAEAGGFEPYAPPL